MGANRKHVTDAELEVLKLLWEQGPSTIRQLTDELYPDGATSHYATVQKLLERLDTKGFVRRRSEGRVNVYRAIQDRTTLIADGLRETADRLCDGSMAPLLTHLVSRGKLSRDEIDDLRSLVERLSADESGEAEPS